MNVRFPINSAKRTVYWQQSIAFKHSVCGRQDWGAQPMKHLKGKVAVVTGAASGIGRATALALADEGVRLILTDIDEEALALVRDEIAKRSECLLTQGVDVSKPEAIDAFAEEVHAQAPAIDILVNCAGVYLTGTLLDLTPEDWDWVLSINLQGTISMCRVFAPPMAKRRQGHIANLASMYGFWPSPCVAGYLTSKFAVFGFSRALREDLRPHGVGVSTVCPGMVNTGIVNSMRIRHTEKAEDLREQLVASYNHRHYGPEKVASAIVRGIRRNRDLVLITPEARIMYRIERYCPPLSRFIARRAAKSMF